VGSSFGNTALAGAPALAGSSGLYRLDIDPYELSIDEERLVALAKRGDHGAFEEIIRIHADRLYAVVRRLCATPHDAEEVTQEAFLRAWRAIDRFDGRSRFFTWLYRIGVNEAKRRGARGEARIRLVPIDEAPATKLPDEREGPELRAEQREVRAAFERAVRALPIDYRAPLVLRDIDGLSTREAAEILGLSEPAFKSRLHRARMSVREAVEGLVREEVSM
jgi:RNA polymerase sigma-70 factor (ECF subfamily)